jgi:hypothetical protein
MIPEERRIANDRLSAMKSLTSSPLTSLGLAIVLAGLIFSCVNFCMVIIFPKLGLDIPRPHRPYIFFGSIAGSVVIFTIVMLQATRDARTLRRIHTASAVGLERDIGRGIVEECRIRTREVIAIDDPEHGDNFLFRLDDAHALLVRGPEDMPNDDFAIVRLPESKEILRIVINGSTIPVSRKIGQHVDKGRFQTGNIIDVKWDDACSGRLTI